MLEIAPELLLGVIKMFRTIDNINVRVQSINRECKKDQQGVSRERESRCDKSPIITAIIKIDGRYAKCSRVTFRER